MAQVWGIKNHSTVFLLLILLQLAVPNEDVVGFFLFRNIWVTSVHGIVYLVGTLMKWSSHGLQQTSHNWGCWSHPFGDHDPLWQGTCPVEMWGSCLIMPFVFFLVGEWCWSVTDILMCEIAYCLHCRFLLASILVRVRLCICPVFVIYRDAEYTYCQYDRYNLCRSNTYATHPCAATMLQPSSLEMFSMCPREPEAVILPACRGIDLRPRPIAGQEYWKIREENAKKCGLLPSFWDFSRMVWWFFWGKKISGANVKMVGGTIGESFLTHSLQPWFVGAPVGTWNQDMTTSLASNAVAPGVPRVVGPACHQDVVMQNEWDHF